MPREQLFAEDTTPLEKGEIEKGVNRLVSSDAQKVFQRWNQAVLSGDKPIYLKLRGDLGTLGDMVRGSYWIPFLEQWSGRKPVIVTKVPQIFRAYQCLPLSANLSADGYMMDGAPIFRGGIIAPRRQDTQFEEVAKFLEPAFPAALLCMDQFHIFQLLSFAYFGKIVENIPQVALSFDKQACDKAIQMVEALDLRTEAIPLLVYPDASKNLFPKKSWDTDYYKETISSLHDIWGDKLRVILLTGVDHPQVTENLSSVITVAGVPHDVLGETRDLAELGSLIEEFAKKGAVMLGTESLVAGHLAPMLGVWSVVIGWNSRYNEIYRPMEIGSALVGGKDGSQPKPKQIIEALNERISKKLNSQC